MNCPFVMNLHHLYLSSGQFCSYNSSMKNKKARPRKGAWILIWAIQFVSMLAAALIVSASYGVHPLLYDVLMWVGMPLIGAVSACACVRRGLLNYAAWIAPPACLYTAHSLLWGYLPPVGPGLLCAFIALVGAATGQVMNERAHKT